MSHRTQKFCFHERNRIHRLVAAGSQFKVQMGPPRIPGDPDVGDVGA